MKHVHYVIIMLIATILTACGGQDATYETVVPAELSEASNIPAPAGKIILTISGNISQKNRGDDLSLDMATLEKFGLVKYEVDDPWLQANVTYTGVLLSDLLKIAGASDSASTVTVVALDGYAADIPMTEIRAWPVMLATRSNGQEITVENNGPTRIIFPYDNHSDVTAARNMSVWNVKRLEVK